MAEKIVPVVKASEEEAEELVDPQQQLRNPSPAMKYKHVPTILKDECSQKPEAQNLWSKYQECNDRVNSRSQTSETCEEELIDYIHVLDKCVNKDLFKRLK
ncbi:cytochrome b-c1 complex subunit 6, mitochondrial-like isoform X1 [Epargyreus clarus]|uniref:cytochrome b-c1 complex subunit 6, mitochondrial-like isoform X1 n=1 Tax=Epargyreus clarus TaxID=520877 RepID=UPI003C30A900